jgi:hypothetical protein
LLVDLDEGQVKAILYRLQTRVKRAHGCFALLLDSRECNRVVRQEGGSGRDGRRAPIQCFYHIVDLSSDLMAQKPIARQRRPSDVGGTTQEEGEQDHHCVDYEQLGTK